MRKEVCADEKMEGHVDVALRHLSAGRLSEKGAKRCCYTDAYGGRGSDIRLYAATNRCANGEEYAHTYGYIDADSYSNCYSDANQHPDSDANQYTCANPISGTGAA